MRVSGSESCHFTLSKKAVGPRGDINAKVSAAGLGFSGTNKSVWFDRLEIDRFVSELQELEVTRKGQATLETMSPGECVVIFRNSDQLGNIYIDVTISRAIHLFGETDYFSCRIRFDVAPSEFPEVVKKFVTELTGRV